MSATLRRGDHINAESSFGAVVAFRVRKVGDGMVVSAQDGDLVSTMTLEAFADTIVPGEKRGPDDVAVAGASTGGGAVASGALALLSTEAGGMAPLLPDVVRGLNEHAAAYIAEHGLTVDDALPAFVALPFEHRLALVARLVGPNHEEKELWVGMAIFCNMAFDTGAHMHTTEAMAAGHPGLRATGFFPPDEDGLWRFPAYSYRRALADLHPGTTATGSPA